MWWFLIALTIFIFGVKFWLYGNDDFWIKRGVPLVTTGEVASIMDQLLFRLPFHELHTRMYKIFKSKGNVKFGGIMEIRRPIVFLMDLDLIQSVFINNFDHFPNRRLFGNKDGLFDKMVYNMDDPPWKEVRTTLAHLFTKAKIANMFQIFNGSGEKMVDFLKTEIEIGNEIEMQEICGHYTLHLLASVAFGVNSPNVHSKNSDMAKMTQRFRNQFTGFGIVKLCVAVMMPKLFDLLRLKFMDEQSANFFTGIVKKTLMDRDRKNSGEKPNDFLQLLMESKGSSQNVYSDDVMVAQCIQFIWAGFDSTETLLMYAAYELAINPDIQEKLAAEVANIISENGEFNYDGIHQLEYLDMVVLETLRKYPPQTRTERQCTKEFEVPHTNLKIEKDMAVAVSIWSIHHDPDIYPDPEKFIPERFKKENKGERHSCAYLPFGLGPRNCLGMEFALTAGKVALAHLVRNFVIHPCSRTTIPMKFLAGESLIPMGGIWMRVERRN